MKYLKKEKASKNSISTSNDSHSGSSYEESSLSLYDICNNNINNYYSQYQHQYHFNNKNYYKNPPKKKETFCYALKQLENFGSIQLIFKENQLFISKIQKVTIEDNFNNLLDKGTYEIGNYFLHEATIPDIYFWYQRYYYYSKFNQGIQMDYESWYSVTPESIAKYIANITKGKTVIDGFCGCGGNTIQFSQQCQKVYAIDIDQRKLDICRNNCKVYKCQNNIEYILSDFLLMKNKIKGDYVFLSPPWGGIKYKNNEKYNITKLMTPNIYNIIRVSLTIGNNIIFYLPRNLQLEELYNIISMIKNEIEKGTGDYLYFDVRILKSNQKTKALIIIFGYELSTMITESNMNEYLLEHYEFVNLDNSKLIWLISNIIGLENFFKKEIEFKVLYGLKNDINQLIQLFMRYVVNEESKIIIRTQYLNCHFSKQKEKELIFANW